MELPSVTRGDKKLERQPDLKGKTREVYTYLLHRVGAHGIRKIQRDLEYSSPSVVSYHINNLINLGLIFKTDEGQYFVSLDDNKSVVLASHFRFASKWIPKSLSYAVTLSFMLIGAIILTIIGYSETKGWALLTIPVLIILIILLLVDSIKMAQNYVSMSEEQV